MTETEILEKEIEDISEELQKLEQKANTLIEKKNSLSSKRDLLSIEGTLLVALKSNDFVARLLAVSGQLELCADLLREGKELKLSAGFFDTMREAMNEPIREYDELRMKA